MLKKIKNRLVFIYTVTTGVILTLVVMVTLFASVRLDNDNKIKAFNNNFNVVYTQIQFENRISNMWIAEEEQKNNLIISMEDNGHSLSFKREKKEGEIRKRLFNKLKEQAKTDNIETNMNPTSARELRSRIYTIKEGNYSYYGQIVVFSLNSGYRSLLMLQRFEKSTSVLIKQGLFFLTVDLLGIAALFLVSRILVGKTLQPVEESRKRQTEFVAAASHELRSPLAVIKATLSMIKKMPLKKEDGLKQIEYECGRMSHLIDDMLFLASRDAGNWSIKTENTEAENLLIEIYEKYFIVCSAANIKLEIDLPEEELSVIKADKERMHQIFSILLDNALRFSKKGGIIVLRGRQIRQGKHKLLLEVEDHGCGINMELKERIFERFYQEDKARNEKKHFGLGLSIAKELCELQGGKIECRDTIGGGCTFTLYF